MGLSRQARSTIVPLLSRLVLAAAFVPAGWDKIMGEPVVYEGQDAAILLRLGVGEPPAEASATGQAVLAFYPQGTETGSIVPHRQPRPNEPEPDEPVVIPVPPEVTTQAPPPKPAVELPKRSPPPPPPVPTPTPTNQPKARPATPEPAKTPSGDSTTVTARRLHRVTIMLVGARWPDNLKPQWGGWAAAGTELIGGGLILLGVFSRIWALGLAITMGVAFYFTSLTPFLQYGIMHLPIEVFYRGFTQIGLFVMAFGVLLGGAGGLSLDGLLFGGDYEEEEEHLLHLG